MSVHKPAKDLLEPSGIASCAFATQLKEYEKENSHLLDQIPKYPLLPAIEQKIKDTIELDYKISTTRGNCIFFHNHANSEMPLFLVKNPTMTILMISLIAETIELFLGNFQSLSVYLVMIIYLVITSSLKSKAESSCNYTFETCVTINAGVGKIVTALFDNSTRPLWEPYLKEVNESFSLHFSYNFKGSLESQSISRHFFPIKNIYYVVEKTQDDEIKNLFKLECKNKHNNPLTLVTHYGKFTESSNPLTGNPDLLGFLKFFIEASITNTNLDKTQFSEESDKEQQEIPPSSLEDISLRIYYNETNRVLCEAKNLLSEQTGWEPLKLKSHFVTASRRKVPGGLYIIKAEGEIQRTPMEIIDCLKDLSRKHHYDTMFESGHIVKLLTDDMGIGYQRFKRIGPVNGRDFCLLQRKIDQKDGSIVAVACSIAHPDCPETECVRGHIYIATHFLIPIGPNTTKMIYILHMDIKGSIPKFIINSTQSDQAMFVENLRAYLN